MPAFELTKIKDTLAVMHIHQLLIACGESMYQTLGLNHWYPYMDLEQFKIAIQEKDLYGVYQNKVVIATFNLSETPRKYYFDKLWSNPTEKALYLGQFAIKPHLQGQGIGQWCMQQVERLALETGCKAIRFDGISHHPWLRKFYEKLGYRFCGVVKPGNWELTCFEKVLE